MFRTLIITTVVLLSALFIGAGQPVKAHSTSQCSMYHTIARGETLFRISLKYNVKLTDLQAWNGITNANRIYAGTDLCVGRITIDDNTGRQYTVTRGDTLSAIARRYGVDLTVLARVNGITNPNRIYVGQVLSIPDFTIQTLP